MFEIEPAGSFIIGDQPVHRMGYGAMQLPGPGVFGPRETVTQQSLFCARLRRDGVDHIDTSEALRPYPLDLVIVNIHRSD